MITWYTWLYHPAVRFKVSLYMFTGDQGHAKKPPQVKAVSFEAAANGSMVALGTAEAHLSIVRALSSLDKAIHSTYEHRNRNLFCEHVADMMQSSTSPIYISFSKEANLSSSLLFRLYAVYPKTTHQPQTPLILQLSMSPHENSSSEGTGIPSTRCH